MRTLALGSLLFCGIAALLGYVATSGVGMRTTGFSQAVVDNVPVPSHKNAAPAPEIEIDAKPIATSKPAAAKAATVVREPRATTRRHATPVKPKLVAAKPEARQDWAKQPVALALTPLKVKRPAPRATEPARTIRTRPLQFTLESQPPIHDESQDMQRDKEAERQWRQQTLDRWRAQERRQSTPNSEPGEARSGSSREESSFGGLYKADQDKKPKKKRHRFLFIRW